MARELLGSWSVHGPAYFQSLLDAFRRNAASGHFALRRSRRKAAAGFTLVEVMVAAAVLALTTVAATQALLQLNRQAAVIRVMNAAKAEALSRIQQVSQCSYAPDATPAVIPTLLKVGPPVNTDIDLGVLSTSVNSTSTDLGSIPGKVTWTVASVPNTSNTLSVKCTITYQYLNKSLSYELSTYKSPD